MAITPEDKGVPIQEIFDHREINRLRFFRWLFKRKPDYKAPQENIDEYQTYRRGALMRKLGRS